MSLTLVDTPGAADANTYCDLADANTYHEGRLYSDTWTNAADADKNAALVMATRLLDQWFEWYGAATSSDQALLWPRTGAYGPNGYLLASDAIPDRVREATAELARLLIDTDRTVDSDIETQGITRLQAGSVELEFSARAGAKVIPDSVLGFVGVLGRKRGRQDGPVTIARG